MFSKVVLRGSCFVYAEGQLFLAELHFMILKEHIKHIV